MLGAQPASAPASSAAREQNALTLVSRDKFILVIGANDPKFYATETRKLLEAIGGAHIEIVEDQE